MHRSRLAGEGSSLWEDASAACQRFQQLSQQYIDASIADASARAEADQARQTVMATERALKAADTVLHGCVQLAHCLMVGDLIRSLQSGLLY